MGSNRISLVLSAMPASTPSLATVAIITNDEGAHPNVYFTALAESPETGSVFLADSSGNTVADARRILGPKLVATYSSATELFAQHQPTVALLSLEASLCPPVIAAALEAGAHIIAEKPGAPTLCRIPPAHSEGRPEKAPSDAGADQPAPSSDAARPRAHPGK